MENRVNANEFLSALTKATKINKGKHTYLPILEEVKIVFTDRKCTLISSNLEQWGVIDIPANGNSFSFVSHNTAAIAKACKYFNNDLVFDYDEDKNTIQLSSGGKSCKQLCFDVKDYPEIPVVESVNTYNTNAKELLNRYNKIKYALSKEDARPIMTGVCFDKDKVLAIDGFRLAMNTNKDFCVNEKFVVPQGMMNLLDGFDKSDINIGVSKNHIIFKSEDVTIISRLLEGEYLDYERILPQNNNEEYAISIKQYTNELKYLKEFVTNKNKCPVKFDNGVLTLDNEDGEYRAKVDIQGESKSIYGYNLNYMLDGLSQFKDMDSITFKADGELKPIVLTDNKENFALVLPVRLKNKNVA